MIVVALAAVFVGFTVLVLAAGYAFGRAEAQDEYEPIIESLQDTIDALTAPRVDFRG